MKNVVSRFSLTQQMVLMASVFVIGLIICMAVAAGVISKVKVTGPVYDEIVQGKDLVADILPPPEYVIESYLVVFQAANEKDGARRNELFTRFQQLKKDYEDRHAYWAQELPQGEIRQIMLVDSYKPAVAFYEAAVRDFFPALQRGDMKKANELLNGSLRANYEAHRKEIDKVVDLTDRKNTSIEDRTKSLLRNYQLLLAVIILLVFTASGVVIALIMRNVAGSFAYCADITNRVASGDLTVHVPVTGRGNIRKMLESLNAMLETLRKIMADVMTASAQIDSSAGRLSASAGQMAGAAEDVTVQIGTVATAGEEMAATSSEIAGNCGMVAQGAKQAHDLAINGTAVVRETIQRMQQIANRVKESAGTVENLGARSDQIGEIVGTIEEIADQTNLLALNAAIEAARAGEQGRGFAVVADEVRALAERTTKATREIAAMIKSIQDETKSAVVSMEEGVKEVELGTGEARRSGDALNEILAQINTVSMQVSQIAVAAEQQTATTCDISNNMQRIGDLVEESTRGTLDSANEANRLTRLAEDLQQIVSQFIIAV